MHCTSSPRVLAVCFSVLLFPLTSAFAQSDPPVVTDQTRSGTGGQFELVDVSNGGVNLTIRLVDIKDRGGEFIYNLNYTSKIWYVQTIPSGAGTQNVWKFRSPWTTFGSG